MSRRDEMLQEALAQFSERGFEGTSIAMLADASGVTKAAFSYHFASKDDILVELAEPLVEDLEAVVAGVGAVDTPVEIRVLLGRYLDVLLRHRPVVVWMDGDKSVMNHPVIGARLRRNNRTMRRLIAGGDDLTQRIRASAVLGALWRPLRNLPDVDVAGHRDEILDIALEGFSR